MFAGGTLLCTALANTATKLFFARVRPEVLTDPITSYSMPSGHASGSFALFLTLAVLAGRGQPPRLRLTWLLLGCIPALSIALSRVYLGAHWPTDILAGAMLASCVCAASLWLSQRKAPLGAMPYKIWWLIIAGTGGAVQLLRPAPFASYDVALRLLIAPLSPLSAH